MKGGPLPNSNSCHKGGMACEKMCGFDGGLTVDGRSNPGDDLAVSEDCRTVMEEKCEEVSSPKCTMIVDKVCDPVQERICDGEQPQDPQTR